MRKYDTEMEARAVAKHKNALSREWKFVVVPVENIFGVQRVRRTPEEVGKVMAEREQEAQKAIGGMVLGFFRSAMDCSCHEEEKED